jgi:hypothetical protein
MERRELEEYTYEMDSIAENEQLRANYEATKLDLNSALKVGYN